MSVCTFYITRLYGFDIYKIPSPKQYKNPILKKTIHPKENHPRIWPNQTIDQYNMYVEYMDELIEDSMHLAFNLGRPR
jgi:hypothetical protein